MATITTDSNGSIKIRATVSDTWRAFGPIATPEELTGAINGQIAEADALTVAQVKRSMRDLGEPIEAGSNHWRQTAVYIGRRNNPRWRRSR